MFVAERTFEDEDLRTMDPADIEERVTRLLDAGDVQDDVADRLRTVDWSGVRIGFDG